MTTPNEANWGKCHMQFLLRKAQQQIETGLAAQQAKQWPAARRHYLQAAEYLFQAAAQSEGHFKAERTRQAEELLARAEELAAAMAQKRPAKPLQPLSATENETDTPWLIHERPQVRFADVAGLEEVKEQIRLKLIYPFTHPDLAAQYGVRRGGGILLYGPPGTGKTLIARAVAGEIEAAFFSVKPSEIMSKWVGEAEQNVQKLFATARAYARSVIFIDEVEALLPKRRSSGSTVMQRVVPQILAELEGFDQEQPGALLFIGATNEPWALDPAVLRPGRFDEKVYVGLPDAAARRRILAIHLAEKPLAGDVNLEQLTEALAGYSGADIANICRKACAIPFVEGVQTGAGRPVAWADFLTVLAGVRPSVAATELARYESYQQAN